MSRIMRYIEDNANDESIGIEAYVEIDIEDWGTQWLEGLIALDRKLELDK